MNKVYKVIWSKAKNCYVVASELAKNRTKAPKSSIFSRAMVAGILMSVLSFGNAFADYGYPTGYTPFESTYDSATGADMYFAGSDGNYIFYQFAKGGNYDLKYQLIVRKNINTGDLAYYLLNNNLHPSSNEYFESSLSEVQSIFGSDIANKIVAATGGASYTAGNGVTISGSTISAKSTNGIVVNGNGIGVKAGTGITVDGNGVSITSGSVTSGNANAITGGTAYSELRPANGTFVKSNQTTAINLTALDTASKNAIKGLSANGNVITYTKGDGTTETLSTSAKYVGINSSNGTNQTGEGAVANDSIAIGKNAKATKKNSIAIGLDSYADEENTISVGHSKTKLDTNGVPIDPDTNQPYVDPSSVTIFDTALTRKITNVANGVNQYDAVNFGQLIGIQGGSVAQGNTKLISGGTAFTELRPADGQFVRRTNTTAQNLTALDTMGKNAVKSMTIDGNTLVYTRGDNSSVSLDLPSTGGGGGSTGGINRFTGDGVTTTVGSVTAFASNTTPTGYLLCDGRAVSRTKYANLFKKIGTTYGAGDGKTTFNLPNLVNRFVEGSTSSGQYIQAGLPNITGRVGAIGEEGTDWTSGAFYQDNNLIAGDDWGVDYSVYMDASRSSSIYGRSDTVQPESLKMQYYIKTDDEFNGSRYMGVNSASGAHNEFGEGAVGTDAIAIGKNASAKGTASVALGKDAVASGSDVVSLGHTATDINPATNSAYGSVLQRRIVNVANGTSASDGATVGQTLVLEDGLNSVVTADGTNSIGQPKFKIDVAGNGEIADNNTGLISGDTLYDEVHLNNDGVYIKQNRTTARNIRELDAQTSSNTTAIAINASDILNLKDMINITDAGRNVIKNLSQGSIRVESGTNSNVVKSTEDGVDIYTVNVNGTGEIAEGETELVSGGTVYETLQRQNLILQDSLNGKADVNASNVTDAEAWADKIGTGTISNIDTKLVTGSTVANETRVSADGSYVLKDNTVAENVSALDTQVKKNTDNIATNTANINTNTADIANLKNLSNITEAGQTVIKDLAKGSVNVLGNDKAIVAKTNENGVDTYTVTVRANGTVTENNADIVTGGTVFRALRNAQNNLETDINSKLNRSLDNITNEGEDVVRNLAKDSVKVVEGLNTTVTEGVDGNATTYAVNVATDGEIRSGDTGIVTGDTVYNAIQNAKLGLEGDTTNLLENKANVDASNITDAQVWGETLGTGIVSETDSKLVTGATVAGETRVSMDGNYVLEDNTAGENLSVLDVQVKENADAILSNTSEITKLKNLSNLSETGKEVIKELSKGSINVTGSGKATVTKSNVNGIDTYNVEVLGNGVIAEGNAQLVTGDTVYNETHVVNDGNYVLKDNTAGENLSTLDVQVKENADAITTLQSNTNYALDTKANIDLDNISTDGKTVIRNLAKDSVKVIAGNDTTVTEGTEGNSKTYAVNVVKNGVVTSGNTGLVTGGTVHDAIQSAIASVNTGEPIDISSKANTDASNITDSSAWAEKLDTGSIIENNAELVSGGKVYTAIQTAKDELSGSLDSTKTEIEREISDGLATKANVGLDNITEDGTNVIRTIANNAVKVADGVNTTVSSETDADGNVTYKVTANATGTVAEGNTGLVDGGTVYSAIETATDDITSSMNDGLAEKANKDASNVADYAEQWGEAIGTGIVAENNDKLVTGGTMYTELRPVNGNYVTNTNTTAQNISALDTQVKLNTDVIQKLQISTTGALGDKANIDLDNLSDEGQEVIRIVAQNSVKVVNGTNTTVTEGTDGTIKTYVVNVVTDGVVEDGNTGIVTGGQVKEAMDTLSSEYAKKDASNIEVSDWASKLGTGTVSNTDTNLVSGATIAQEVHITEDGSFVQKDNTVAQNISALDTALKETRELAESVNAGADTDAVHYDGLDKSIVTLAGENGTIITNLKDGELSADSRDAVTGKQLFKTNEKVAENTEQITVLTDKIGTISDGNYVSSDKSIGENLGALDTHLKTVSDGLDSVITDVDTLKNTVTETVNNKANTDLGNITDSGRTVISDIAKNAVKVEGSGLATVTSATERNTTIYTVDVQADGLVEEGNTGLVSGDTVYHSIQEVRNDFSDNLNEKADVDLGNLTDAGKDAIREAVRGDLDNKADKSDLDSKANVDASNIDTSAWAEKLGTGKIAEGNTDLINGGTAYRALQSVMDNQVAQADFDYGVIRIANQPKYDDIDFVDISKSDGSGRILTGVVTNPYDASSAANVGYVNAVGESILRDVNAGFSNMDSKINKAGAGAVAIASLMPAPMEEDEKWSVSAAVGNYHDATAGAVGVFYRPQDNVMMNVRGSFGNDENMVGGGVSIALQRGNTPSVSKAQLVHTINAQANKITEMEKKHSAEMAEMKANYNAEIAEMKAQMAELAKQVKNNNK